MVRARHRPVYGDVHAPSPRVTYGHDCSTSFVWPAKRRSPSLSRGFALDQALGRSQLATLTLVAW